MRRLANTLFVSFDRKSLSGRFRGTAGCAPHWWRPSRDTTLSWWQNWRRSKWKPSRGQIRYWKSWSRKLVTFRQGQASCSSWNSQRTLFTWYRSELLALVSAFFLNVALLLLSTCRLKTNWSFSRVSHHSVSSQPHRTGLKSQSSLITQCGHWRRPSISWPMFVRRPRSSCPWKVNKHQTI